MSSTKELSAAGLITALSGFAYGLYSLGNLGGAIAGPLAAVLTAAFLCLVLLVGGLGILWRASWGWTVGLLVYTVAIGVQVWSFLSRGVLIYTVVLVPLLLGCGLYLLLSRDDFDSATRPSDPGRPNYP
jgi:hypothetical protein